jgi:hypothetical protein
MIVRFGLVLLAASLSACGEPSANAFKAKPLPKTGFDVPQAVFADLLANFPQGAEGAQEMTLTVTEPSSGTKLVLLTIEGLLDDSVGAEQHRAVARFDRGKWRVAELGERWMCRRGPSSGWTTRPCN